MMYDHVLFIPLILFLHCLAETERASMEEQAALKDVHLAELTKSIGNIQSQSHNREAQLNHQLHCAESKMKELENTLAVTKGELNVYNNERSTLKETLNESKQERLAALKRLDEMKGRIDEVKENLHATMSQLNLEKELRAKSEQKEREERNERIALSAQMLGKYMLANVDKIFFLLLTSYINFSYDEGTRANGGFSQRIE